MGKEDAPARIAFLDAAETLLCREGYRSATARRVAEEAGQKKQLLFYYFKSMDELICETFVRHVQNFSDRLEIILAGESPLHALWDLHNKGNARLFAEFMAIANHNEILRQEISHYSKKTNAMQTRALETLMKNNGVDPDICPPQLMVFLFSSVTRNLAVEKELGIFECGEELERFLCWCISRMEPDG